MGYALRYFADAELPRRPRGNVHPRHPRAIVWRLLPSAIMPSSPCQDLS